MAKNTSTENAEVDSQDAEQTPPPEEQQSPEEPIEQQENITPEQQEGEGEQPTEPAPKDEAPTYSLPPTLAEAGGVGIVGMVSGMFTVSNGSYLLSPGQPLMMSAEDAQALVDQGVAVMLDTYKIN